MSSMQFMSLKDALEIAEFPANYNQQQVVAALVVLANVVKKEIDNKVEKKIDNKVEKKIGYSDHGRWISSRF